MNTTALPDDPRTWSALSPVLRESWLRSAQYLPQPEGASAPIDLGDADLREYRRNHPLSVVLPVFDQLLVQPAAEAGLIAAIGDADGRLLWVDGDRQTLRRAESGAFQAGANWSEQAIGTSAPGAALATGRGVQVHGEEHFAPIAHQFSCSAAPVKCPHTGALLGFVDLTGGERAVATHSLPLIHAAIAAAEAELRVLPPYYQQTQLTTLGLRSGMLSAAGVRRQLSLRHTELLFLLAWDAAHPHVGSQVGMTATELGEAIYGEPGHEVSIRAELLRLRKLLSGSPAAGGLVLESRPYRLQGPLHLDAHHLEQALAAGDRSTALDLYGGPVLPESQVPGVEDIRRRVSALMREAMLQDGSAEQLWRYLQLVETRDDRELLMTALKLLPADSPRRAALMAAR